jgi:hypothetical protein
MDAYELIYRYDDFITQLPFELKLTMPPTDRGGRGYSDEFVAKAVKELESYTRKHIQSE